MWVKKMHFSAKQWVHNEKKYQKNARISQITQQLSPTIKNSPIFPPKKRP
jgi:hypothetical protein